MPAEDKRILLIKSHIYPIFNQLAMSNSKLTNPLHKPTSNRISLKSLKLNKISHIGLELNHPLHRLIVP